MQCPHEHADERDVIWFCCEDELNSHLSGEHDDHAGTSLSEKVSTSGSEPAYGEPLCVSMTFCQINPLAHQLPAFTELASPVAEESTDAATTTHLQTTSQTMPIKRSIIPESRFSDTTKRLKLNDSGRGSSTLEGDLRAACRHFRNLSKTSSSDAGHLELAVPNIQPADFLRLSNSGGKYIDFVFNSI